MEELYRSLILNLDTIRHYDLTNDDSESGSPTGLTTIISMLYLLVKNNNELLQIEVNGKLLYYYLFNLAKYVLIDDYEDKYSDEEKTEYSLEMYISEWMNKPQKYYEYYCSNDAYNLYGVTKIQLQRLLLLSK